MKKNLIFVLMLLVSVTMLFVACSPEMQAEKTGAVLVSFAPQTADISATTTNIAQVGNLYWYYKAEKKDNGIYKTGETSGFVRVSESIGLTEESKVGNTYSYGNWDFTFVGVSSATTPTDVNGQDVVLYAKATGVEVNKDKTYVNLNVEDGNGLGKEIVFGDVSFAYESIAVGQTYQLTISDKVNSVEVANIVVTNPTVVAGSVTFSGLTYTPTSGTITEGEHVMTFTLEQTGNTVGSQSSFNVAFAQVNFYVAAGSKVTISGTLNATDVTGEVYLGSVTSSVKPVYVNKVVEVESATDKTVKTDTMVSTQDLTVKFPQGVKLAEDTATATNSELKEKADAHIGFEYKQPNLSEQALNKGIEINAGQEAVHYDLTLNVDESNTTHLLTVEKTLAKNLEIEHVYHNGVEIPVKDGTGYSATKEYYEYDLSTGKMTLHVFHASPIDIVTKKVVAAIGSVNYTTLQEAITAATAGQTVKLLENVEENVNIPSGKSITLDMNGKTLNGGTVSETPAITNNGTLVITGNGTIKREDTGTSAYYVIDNQGTLTIKNGTVTNGSGSEEQHAGASLIRNGEDTLGAKLYIEGGQLIQPKFNVIKNGDGQSEVHISGGTISCNQKFAVLTYGPLYISGGDITGPIDIVGYREDNVDHSGNAIISGGKINGPLTVRQYTGCSSDTIPSLTITGGEFGVNTSFAVGEGKSASELTQKPECGVISITGGTFSSDPSAYVAAGYQANSDTPEVGMWTVNASFTNGKGTKESPWEIACVEDWNTMNKVISNGSECYFKVVEDFGFSSSEPIDNACLSGKTVSFHLDGGNHTIGITHNQTASFKNLFGRVAKNVYVKDIIFDYAFDYEGDLSFTYTTTEDCECEFTNVTITGSINTNDTTAWICPLIQYPAGSVKYTNVTNYANITGSAQYVAPFGVHAFGTALITFDKCANYGNVMGTNAGGFWGMTPSSPSVVIFKDTDAAKNYGKVFGAETTGHFKQGVAGNTFSDKNGLTITVAQEGSEAIKCGTFASSAPENYGDTFTFAEVENATSYSVKVSFASSRYGYVGVGDVWGGGFFVALQDDYTSANVNNNQVTTRFKKLYIAEKQNSKKHYVSQEAVTYSNGIYYADFTLEDIVIAPIENGKISLIETEGKEFYYYDSNDEFGALVGDSETTDKTVTFTVFAYDAKGNILKTSTCSYKMSIADARKYFSE